MYDEADKAAFVEAADSSGKEFPKNVFALPSTKIMVAEIEGKPVLYQPHFVSLNLGSIIPVGYPSKTELASAQHMLTGTAFTRATTEGFADIIAFSNNENTRAFAMRHGYIATPDGLILGVR